jgi:predicted MFS family arabinose efflux permease
MGVISWMVAGLFYLYEMILRTGMSVIAEELRLTFGLMSTQIGLLASAYHYAYVPLQVPCGMMLDALGVRKLLTFSCALCTLGAYVFAESPSPWAAALGRFIIGAGSAGAFIGCLKLVAGWFDSRYFAVMTGITNMMGCLGSVFAGKPLAVYMHSVGWRVAMMHLATAGVVMTAGCWFLIRDPEKRPQDHWPMMKALQLIIRKKEIWLAGAVGGLMYLPITAFAEMWGVPFLKMTYHISEGTASIGTMAMFIGMAIGGPLSGTAAEKMKSYRLTMMLASALLCLLFFAVAYAQFISFLGVVFLLFWIGVLLGAQVLSFSLSQVQSPKQTSGTAAALTNAVIMLGGLIVQPLLGVILDLFWDQKTNASGIRIYSPETYRWAIFVLPLCLLGSVILLFFMQEKKRPGKN